jgi:hypothetical protein
VTIAAALSDPALVTRVVRDADWGQLPDRIVALPAGMDSMREVIAFAKTGGGVAPLADAPGRGSV